MAEIVRLNFSIKKCKKDDYYQIKVTNEDPSLGSIKTFETENLKCLEEGKELIFQKTIEYNYYFNKKQKLKINFLKSIKEGNNYNIKRNERYTFLSSLVIAPNSIYERPLNPKINNSELLCIKLIKINSDDQNKKNESIFDYLTAGLKLSCFVSIDCSQGTNKQKIEISYKNYKKIINSIKDKIANYTKDEYFIYGYGANLRNKDLSNELYKYIFNINLEEDKSIHFANFSQIYDKCINYIISEKKVCLSLMVKKITKDIFRFYDERYYNIFFILARELTDTSDKQNTIDAFIESGYLPLTIIIIGEGKNNFESMKELFGKKIKQSSNGMLKNRDNIIFMNFSDDFNENSELLAEWCLREISKQILCFYNLAKCSPEQIKKNNIGNIKNSINIYKQSFALYESKIIGLSQMENQQFKLSKMPIMNKKHEKNIYENPNNININQPRQISQKNNINNIKFTREKINTPKNEDDYIITPDNPIKTDFQPKNIYQEKKTTLEINNIQRNNNNISNDPKIEIYKITPEKSIREEINENPYIKKESETPSGDYIIPKQNSICPDFKSNPYNEKNIINPQEETNYHVQKNNNRPNQNKLNSHNYGNNETNMIQKNNINGAKEPRYINANNINDSNKKPLGK